MSLQGERVVVTRPRHQADSLAKALEKVGARVIRMPLIAITDPSSWEPLDRALLDLAGNAYRWVVFASANAVVRVLGRPHAVVALRRAKVAAVGPTTSAELRRGGVDPALVPARHTLGSLAEALGEGPGKVLFPRVEHAPALPDAFTARGWTVDEVPAYRNSPAPRGAAHGLIERGEFDVITFSSPSAIDAFVASVAWEPLGLRPGDQQRRTVACIGPTTAARASQQGMRVDVVPVEPTPEGLVDALLNLRV